MLTDSAVTERDLGRDLDRLADELRTYDQARGLENQDVIDNVRALREELQDLANFLHRTPPPPPSPPVVVQPERLETPTPRRTVLVDASVGRTTSISSGQHFLPLPPTAPTSLSRATSNASSFNSYLSSHHSDDDIYDEEPTYSHSPPWTIDDEVDATIDSASSPSSGSTSLGPSSPELPPDEVLVEVRVPSVVYEPSIPYEPSLPSLPRESPVAQAVSEPADASETSEPSTVRPPADLLRSIGGLGDQLQALKSGQDAAHDLLMSLLRRPEDPTTELADRLRRIEDLVQALVDQGHPRGPEIVQDVPPAPVEPVISFEPEGSVSDSESLGYLGSILGRLTRDGPFMPVPVTAPQGSTMAQRLDEILSSGHQIPVVGIDQPPNVDPFVYRPVERGQRARSESPGSLNLPLRPRTVPFVVPLATYSNVGPERRPSDHPRRPRTVVEEDFEPTPLPSQPPVSPQPPQGPSTENGVQPPPVRTTRHGFPTPPTPGPLIVSRHAIYH